MRNAGQVVLTVICTTNVVNLLMFGNLSSDTLINIDENLIEIMIW